MQPQTSAFVVDSAPRGVWGMAMAIVVGSSLNPLSKPARRSLKSIKSAGSSVTMESMLGDQTPERVSIHPGDGLRREVVGLRWNAGHGGGE